MASAPSHIYLDHAATTALRPEVLDAMLPFLTAEFGNPSSPHAPGRRARAALDDAHERLAGTIGAKARELVFTSGGTEANNLAVKGAAWASKARGNRILTSSVEHHSVAHALRQLEHFGFEIVELPVDRYGRLDPDIVDAAIDARTVLVSVMLANNEVGTIEPVAEIARRAHAHKGVLVHADAVQAAPYLDIDVEALDVDLLSVGAHKAEGPKGVGALFIRHGIRVLPQQQGGSQERHRRAGTEDVAGAVGMALAFELARSERPDVEPRLRALRDRLRIALTGVEGTEQTGHPTDRLPALASIIVAGVDGPSVVLALDLVGIACSTGSACTSGSNEPSDVLRALGYPPDEARGALRFSLGRTTTEDQIERAIEILPPVLRAQRDAAAQLAADPLGQRLAV